MFTIYSTIFEAERVQTVAEQRAVDIRRGELARGIHRLLHRDRGARVPDCPCSLLQQPASGSAHDTRARDTRACDAAAQHTTAQHDLAPRVTAGAC